MTEPIDDEASYTFSIYQDTDSGEFYVSVEGPKCAPAPSILDEPQNFGPFKNPSDAAAARDYLINTYSQAVRDILSTPKDERVLN